MGTVGEPEKGTGRLLFRKLIRPRSLRRMQAVIPRKLSVAVLEMMHDNVTAGHMGIRKTLVCPGLRFFWYKQRKSVGLWCRGCTRCSERKAGGVKRRRVDLKKSVTEESLLPLLVLIFQVHIMSSVAVTST